MTADDSERKLVIVAKPGELDATPIIPSLVLDYVPRNLSPDRLAVGAILAFAPYISGQIVLDRQISALTAQVIEDLFDPIWVNVAPLHPANIPLPRGKQRRRLTWGGQPDVLQHSLRLVDRSESVGISVRDQAVTVSTNALDLNAVAPANSRLSGMAAIGMASILAEDLDASIFDVDAGLMGADGETLRRVSRLMSATGLGLNVEGAA
ncbi:hypothetical protein ACQ7DA_07620 [Zafaria sp. J156]|uniref:hypothetical protein n=1 Tax=Zafaria sp. J156 TaxID=3116490 RepID=UPI002E7909CF|nr:hypothetical protein [Zafaria sp. J156]MEE1620761.1 hypothetical protein [Zafaria sp. J156]